jgi:hypothetical protein
MAVNPDTGCIVEWSGPLVPGITFFDANDYCQNNGLGYCEVTGIYTGEVPFDENILFDQKYRYN